VSKGRPAGVALALVLVGALGSSACSDSDDDGGAQSAGNASTGGFEVNVVSGRADMVTGGDALLAVEGGEGTPTAKAGDTALKVTPLKDWWLVSGLPEGASKISVERGDKRGEVEVQNYPTTGPVFSGPHMPLLECTTQDFGLGKAVDDNCSAPTKTDRIYFSEDGKARPLADGKIEPLRGVTKIDVKGESVTLVAEREIGVLNRSVYTTVTPVGDAWNGRLVYRYGGGCGTTYSQGSSMTSAEAVEFLRLGYAVATATFNTFQVQCNDVLSAETTMLVKEHFIETHGVPVHTIGEGASGGAIQQHLILQNYPGLLDASVAILPFPDATSVAPGVSDCGLLNRYYRDADLSEEQRAAINGHAVASTCVLWENSFLEGIRPSDGCAGSIPKSEIYDAKTNPDGLRCDLVDANINTLGRDPETGFANRPLDNVGVQYGLEALRSETITLDQFLDLNEKIGGFDVDGAPVAERSVAKEDALKIVYAKGRVSEGGGDQRKAPLIDLNVYQDNVGDIHDRFRAFSLRERLDRSENFVIWTRGGVIGNILSGGGGAGNGAIPLLDRWLDTGTIPPEAIDNCPGANDSLISGRDIYDKPGPCRDNYPLNGDPRTAAGAPLRNDILKCQLRPIDPAEYETELTPAQRERLDAIFPDGVCDWTKPGVGQVELEGTWLRY
jgi:hypothetical protein